MSTFPTSKDTFVNPTPTTPKNDPAVPLSSAISRLNSAVVAIEDTVGITGSIDPASIQRRLDDVAAVAAAADGAIAAHVAAGNPHSQYTTQTEVLSLVPAETVATVGALVVAGDNVTTPQDVDLIPLAVSSVLKKFSWANLKAALAQLFPLLAGASGGQTINGGTTAAQNLTLRSTAHATKGAIIFGAASSYDEANNRLGIGTLTPAAKVHALATTEQLRLGYDDSNYLSCTVSSAGQTAFNGSLGQYAFLTPVASTATLGAELVSNNSFATDLASWTAGAGWSWSSGGALHTAGNTATLETTVAVTSGQTYEIIITISNRTAGSISVAIGAASVIESGTTTAFTASFDTGVVAAASGSVALIITPTSDFNGRVDDVSVRQVTLISAPALMRITESGSSSFEMRVSRVLESMSCGLASHRSHVSGIYNTSYGFSAARDILTGEGNSSFGRGACYALTTGDNNSAFGRSAAVALTTGGGNCMFGFNSGRGITTTSNNITIGSDAGRYLANGSTALSTPSNSVFVGALTKASANNITAENVFGYNATGIGNNTTVIGASTNVKTQIFGDIVFDKTVTSSGTTGAQTIDKTVGSVNFAAGATSLVVTNSRVTASSIIVATVATNDATMKSVSAVSASGSFTLTANAAATAETRVNFIVIN
jgi:hypothetical protein